jgi:CheY-like chemotaxis protein
MTRGHLAVHLQFARVWKIGRLRVMIVEDELRMTSRLRRSLVNGGLPADVAGKAKEALWMARVTTTTPLVLDEMLPGRSSSHEPSDRDTTTTSSTAANNHRTRT